jgi:hypothetical protein
MKINEKPMQELFDAINNGVKVDNETVIKAFNAYIELSNFYYYYCNNQQRFEEQ